jgi:dTDP-glucose pyrophosphorylase
MRIWVTDQRIDDRLRDLEAGSKGILNIPISHESVRGAVRRCNQESEVGVNAKFVFQRRPLGIGEAWVFGF